MELRKDRYTVVTHEDDIEFNAPHHFEVHTLLQDYSLLGNPGDIDRRVCQVNFQKGPIKEAGINGVMNEDLLLMVITRLQHFQNSQFACRENAIALTKLEEALMWMNKRTEARNKRGVEGTHKV